MADNIKVIISAYCVDSNDVGEAKMAYEWITRIAKFKEVIVITTGSRINETCGLENQNNVTLIKLTPKISFKRFDKFDRAVHPGYIEYFYRAKKIFEKLIKPSDNYICHHLAPQSPRYPCPFIDGNIPYIVGPFHGGLGTPKEISDLGSKEGFMFKLRALDKFRILYDPYLNKHYKRASKIVVSAPYVKEILPIEYHSKTEIVYGVGIDNSFIKSCDRNLNNTIKLIFVGRLEASKGLELLLLAISKLRDLDIKLAVCGIGSLQKYFKDLSAKLKIEHIINWLGFIENSKVIELYKENDIFVFPSLKEPAGIAVIEAMASGLPIICVNYGGPSYSVNEQCGIKIPIGNKEYMVNCLAEGIKSLAVDRQKRLDMGRNAIDRVKDEFIWDVVISKILNLYEEVATAKR